MKALIKTLTIDPGLITGWAFWHGLDDLPIASGFIKFSASKKSIEDYQGRIHEMTNKFSSLLIIHKIKNVYIEFPDYWAGSFKSYVAMTSGSLVKLAFTVGCYSSLAYRYGCNVYFLSPEKWKGQMNKDVTAKRVEIAISRTYKDDNEMDAVGMGLSLMGLL